MYDLSTPCMYIFIWLLLKLMELQSISMWHRSMFKKNAKTDKKSAFDKSQFKIEISRCNFKTYKIRL